MDSFSYSLACMLICKYVCMCAIKDKSLKCSLSFSLSLDSLGSDADSPEPCSAGLLGFPSDRPPHATLRALMEPLWPRKWNRVESSLNTRCTSSDALPWPQRAPWNCLHFWALGKNFFFFLLKRKTFLKIWVYPNILTSSEHVKNHTYRQKTFLYVSNINISNYKHSFLPLALPCTNLTFV